MAEYFSPITNATIEEKLEAVKDANYAQRQGWIKPQPCRDCGQLCWRVLHKHHYDYTKHFDVIWLCRKCHAKEHARINLNLPKQEPFRLEKVAVKKLTFKQQQKLERIEKLIANSAPNTFEIDLENLTVKFSDKP